MGDRAYRQGGGYGKHRFHPQDFEVFGIPTFPERMQGIKEYVRPKLIALGEDLQPALKKACQERCVPTCGHTCTADCEPTP